MTYNRNLKKDYDSMTLYYVVGFNCWVLDFFFLFVIERFLGDVKKSGTLPIKPKNSK